MYEYTASIVLYNSPVHIAQKAIDSFIHSIKNANAIIILIDHSPENTLETQLNIKDERIHYYHHPENNGYGAGHNIAMKKVIDFSPIHYIINPDVEFTPNVITTLNKVLNEHSQVGSVMPKIIDQNGKIQYLAKLLPYPIDVIGKRFLPKKWMEKRLDRFQLKYTGYNKVMNVPYLSGCFMCLRTSALKKIGLFDERFFMYPEDIDLTRRIHTKYETWYYPHVEIVHHHEAASYKSKKMLFVHIKNMIKYFNKWGWFFDKNRDQINRKVLEQLKGI